MSPEDSGIEKLQKDLYKRGAGPGERERRELHPLHDEAEVEVAHGWHTDTERDSDHDHDYEDETEHPDESRAVGAQTPGFGAGARRRAPDEESTLPTASGNKRIMSRIVKTIFFSSLIFFLIAVGIAGWVYVKGSPEVTCSKLDIAFRGPISVASGKELLLDVGITNKNPVSLHDAHIIFDYPEGARAVDNTTAALPSLRERIGDIESGEEVTMTTRAVLFGPEKSEQIVKVTIEYALNDSNAVFTCGAEKQVLITTAPVALSVNGLEEVSSGQELVLTAVVRSNSNELVPDQRLVVEYPFGFEFVRAEPEPTSGTNVWDVGDMVAGVERTVEIRGVVRAQTVESRTVRFSLGEGDGEEGLLNTLQYVEHPLLIARPFLKLDLTLNGGTESVVSAKLGEQVTGQIHWKNTQDEPLYDVNLEMRLPSEYIARQTVAADKGYFRSVDNTLLWNPQTYVQFKEVAPGGEGNITFRFNTAPLPSSAGVQDPFVNLSFDVSARRVADAFAVEQQLLSQAQRTIQFITDLKFTPEVFFSIGPFVNTGPYPSRADERTTYAVVWTVENTTSDLEDVTVKGTLPVNVEWTNRIAPSDADVIYNPTTHEVAWNVGNVATLGGVQDAAKSMTFQVALIPSITQIGSEAPLVQSVTARGVDVFTGNVLEQGVDRQTTKLSNDPAFPSYPENDGRVTN